LSASSADFVYVKKNWATTGTIAKWKGTKAWMLTNKKLLPTNNAKSNALSFPVP